MVGLLGGCYVGWVALLDLLFMWDSLFGMVVCRRIACLRFALVLIEFFDVVLRT